LHSKCKKKPLSSLTATTGESPVEAIRVENSDFDNKEWETTVTQVISWWWGYKVHEVNREELSVSVREDGSELTVKWLQPGTFYFTLKDQYNQTANFQVRVRDVNLELVKYELQLNPWQEEIVYFHEYYKGITKLVKNNENASIYLGDDEQGKYLKIVWQEEWITIFQVEDVQGNTKTGKITVWPGSVTEPENPGDPVEPEPLPEEDETPEEKELREFLEALSNEAEWVQINELTGDEARLLQEKKILIDDIAGRIKISNLSNTKIQGFIQSISELKNRLYALEYWKKEYHFELLSYLWEALENILKVEITSSEYTPDVEDWYIGWFYFTVDNPYGIEEAWIEYYNATSTSESNMVWKKQILENEKDWEFATFILPKTKYTLVRWYVVDKEWNKKYTNESGQIISSEVALLEYYELADNSEISTQSATVLLRMLVWIGAFGFWLYEDAKCIEQFTESQTFADLSCYVWAGSTVVGAMILWKAGVPKLAWIVVWGVAISWKKFINLFKSKQSVQEFADALGKSVDDVARLWLTWGGNPLRWMLNTSNTYVSTWWDIISKFTKYPDFISRIKFLDDNNLMIREIFKGSIWDVDFKTSNLVLDQISFVWKDPKKINIINLEDVVNIDILKAIEDNWTLFVKENWGSIGGLDWMTKNIIDKLGKEIDTVNIIKDLDIHIRLNLK